MPLQPSDRSDGSSLVLRFTGQVTQDVALATFPKVNGGYANTGLLASSARFLFADATNLTNTKRQLPAFVFDDTVPAGSAPHAAVASVAVPNVLNAGELVIGSATANSANKTWCQNTYVRIKATDGNLIAVDTENAVLVIDTLTSGLGLNTGLPVLVLPVTLASLAATQFGIDLLIEIRHSTGR